LYQERKKKVKSKTEKSLPLASPQEKFTLAHHKHDGHSATLSQTEAWNISRQDAKAPRKTFCHFDRREKSFSEIPRVARDKL
jgi:hypothetical protein